MNINLLVGSLLVLGMGYLVWQAVSTPKDALAPNFLPFVPIDVRKSKVYVSKTRDAGMFVERQRRLAILTNSPFVPSYRGFTNGVVERSLTGIGFNPFPKSACPLDPAPVVWSNGDADDVICDNVDAGGAFGLYDTIDFGGAAGNVCPP